MVPRGWTSPLNSTSGELQTSLLADTALKIYQSTKIAVFNNFMIFALRSGTYAYASYATLATSALNLDFLYISQKPVSFWSQLTFIILL